MNLYLSSQVVNMLAVTKAFRHACQLATENGSKDDKKTMKKIEAATKRFIKEIEKLI